MLGTRNSLCWHWKFVEESLKFPKNWLPLYLVRSKPCEITNGCIVVRYKERTRLSSLDIMLSKHRAVFFATARTSKGSKRAASSSFITIRAMFRPSVAPGGIRVAPENACPTASLILLEDLDRY